jgi:hypothetical protein
MYLFFMYSRDYVAYLILYYRKHAVWPPILKTTDCMYPGASMPATMTVAFLYLAEERLTHVDAFCTPPPPLPIKGEFLKNLELENKSVLFVFITEKESNKKFFFRWPFHNM